MMEEGWDEGPLVNDTAFDRISQSLRELNRTLSTANARPFDRPTTGASMFPPALKPVALAGTAWPLSGLATLENSNLEWLCRTYPLACCSLTLGSSQSPELNPQGVESIASRLIIALCASSAVLTCDGLLRQALRVPCEEAGKLSLYVQLLSLCGQGTQAGGEEAADEELRESYISMCTLIVCGLCQHLSLHRKKDATILAAIRDGLSGTALRFLEPLHKLLILASLLPRREQLHPLVIEYATLLANVDTVDPRFRPLHLDDLQHCFRGCLSLGLSPGSEGGRERQAVEEWEGFRSVSMAYLTQQLRHLLSTRAKPYEWSLPTLYLPKPDQLEALARIWPMTVAGAEKSQFTQLLCAEQRLSDQSARRSGQALLNAAVSILMQSWDTRKGCCRYSDWHVAEHEAHLPNPFTCGYSSHSPDARAIAWSALPREGRSGLREVVVALLHVLEEPSLAPGQENSWLHGVQELFDLLSRSLELEGHTAEANGDGNGGTSVRQSCMPLLDSLLHERVSALFSKATAPRLQTCSQVVWRTLKHHLTHSSYRFGFELLASEVISAHDASLVLNGPVEVGAESSDKQVVASLPMRLSEVQAIVRNSHSYLPCLFFLRLSNAIPLPLSTLDTALSRTRHAFPVLLKWISRLRARCLLSSDVQSDADKCLWPYLDALLPLTLGSSHDFLNPYASLTECYLALAVGAPALPHFFPLATDNFHKLAWLLSSWRQDGAWSRLCECRCAEADAGECKCTGPRAARRLLSLAKKGADHHESGRAQTLDAEVMAFGKMLTADVEQNEQGPVLCRPSAPSPVPAVATFALFHQICSDPQKVTNLLTRFRVSDTEAALVQFRASGDESVTRTPTRKRKAPSKASADTPETPKLRRTELEAHGSTGQDAVESCVQTLRFVASHATSTLLRFFIPSCLERSSPKDSSPQPALRLVVQALVSGATSEGTSPAPHLDAYGVYFYFVIALLTAASDLGITASDVLGFVGKCLADETRPVENSVRRNYATIADALPGLGLGRGVSFRIQSLSVTVMGSAGALLIRESNSFAQDLVQAELGDCLASFRTTSKAASGVGTNVISSHDSSNSGGFRSSKIGRLSLEKVASSLVKGTSNDAPVPAPDIAGASKTALACVHAVVHANPKAMVLLALSCLGPGWGQAWDTDERSDGGGKVEEDAMTRLLRLLLLMFRSCWLPAVDAESSPLDDMINLVASFQHSLRHHRGVCATGPAGRLLVVLMCVHPGRVSLLAQADVEGTPVLESVVQRDLLFQLLLVMHFSEPGSPPPSSQPSPPSAMHTSPDLNWIGSRPLEYIARLLLTKAPIGGDGDVEEVVLRAVFELVDASELQPTLRTACLVRNLWSLCTSVCDLPSLLAKLSASIKASAALPNSSESPRAFLCPLLQLWVEQSWVSRMLAIDLQSVDGAQVVVCSSEASSYVPGCAMQLFGNESVAVRQSFLELCGNRVAEAELEEERMPGVAGAADTFCELLAGDVLRMVEEAYETVELSLGLPASTIWSPQLQQCIVLLTCFAERGATPSHRFWLEWAGKLCVATAANIRKVSSKRPAPTKTVPLCLAETLYSLSEPVLRGSIQDLLGAVCDYLSRSLATGPESAQVAALQSLLAACTHYPLQLAAELHKDLSLEESAFTGSASTLFSMLSARLPSFASGT